jgi:hypothetical protein
VKIKWRQDFGRMTNDRPLQWGQLMPGLVLGVRLYDRTGWTMQFAFGLPRAVGLGDMFIVSEGMLAVTA